MRNILNVLHEAEFADSQWELLGEQLINGPDLKNIDTNRRGNPNLCMIDTLSHWLKSDREASWEKLAKAIPKVQGYGEATANIVQEKAGIGKAYTPVSWLPMHLQYSSGTKA